MQGCAMTTTPTTTMTTTTTTTTTTLATRGESSRPRFPCFTLLSGHNSARYVVDNLLGLEEVEETPTNTPNSTPSPSPPESPVPQSSLISCDDGRPSPNLNDDCPQDSMDESAKECMQDGELGTQLASGAEEGIHSTVAGAGVLVATEARPTSSSALGAMRRVTDGPPAQGCDDQLGARSLRGGLVSWRVTDGPPAEGCDHELGALPKQEDGHQPRPRLTLPKAGMESRPGQWSRNSSKESEGSMHSRSSLQAESRAGSRFDDATTTQKESDEIRLDKVIIALLRTHLLRQQQISFIRQHCGRMRDGSSGADSNGAISSSVVVSSAETFNGEAEPECTTPAHVDGSADEDVSSAGSASRHQGAAPDLDEGLGEGFLIHIPEGFLCCRHLLDSLEILQETLRIEFCDRSHREAFPTNYRSLFRPQKRYAVHVLSAAMQDVTFLWVNGERHDFSEQVIESRRLLLMWWIAIIRHIETICECLRSIEENKNNGNKANEYDARCSIELAATQLRDLPTASNLGNPPSPRSPGATSSDVSFATQQMMDGIRSQPIVHPCGRSPVVAEPSETDPSSQRVTPLPDAEVAETPDIIRAQRGSFLAGTRSAPALLSSSDGFNTISSDLRANWIVLLRRKLACFDRSYRDFEQAYVSELVLIERRAKLLIWKTIHQEGILSLMESQINSVPWMIIYRERQTLISMINHINYLVSTEDRPLVFDGIPNACAMVLEDAEKDFPGRNEAKLVRALAIRAEEAFAAVRQYLRNLRGNMDRCFPDLYKNAELVRVLSEWDEAWSVGSEYLYPGRERLALSIFVEYLKEKMEIDETFRENILCFEPSVLFEVPGDFLSKFKTYPEKYAPVVELFNLNQDELLCSEEEEITVWSLRLQRGYAERWNVFLQTGIRCAHLS